MSKKANLKKSMLLLCLAFIISLGSLGVGWGMWTDSLNVKASIQTARFDPQVKLWNVTRWFYWIVPLRDDYPFSRIPNDQDKITVKVGMNSSNDISGVDPDHDERYRYNFQVINTNSDIPIRYRARKLLTGSEGANVTVHPENWTTLLAGQSTSWDMSINYAEIYTGNPFSGNNLNKDFAVVEIQQFNGEGWTYKAIMRIQISF